MTTTLETQNGSYRHSEPITRTTAHRLTRMERRLSEISESSETRIAVLRDAIGEFIAAELEARDSEIILLKNQIAELERQLQTKSEVDQQVTEITKRLDARAVARDEARRGPKAVRGERGARGERGQTGARGPAGKPADPALSIHSWHIDRQKYRITPLLSNGKSLPSLDLRPLFESYHYETNS